MKKVMKAIAAIMLMTAVCATGCNKDDDDDWGGNNSNSDVRVTTYEPQNITQTTATIMGEVDVVADGITVTDMGVCWDTLINPTVSDNHISANGKGTSFTCTITGLEPGTKYYVRVYATDGLAFFYGTSQSFTTQGNSGGGYGSHTWVDLGLPSGTLWATCNVGANTPEDYGDYFAWGETTPKEYYDWNTYKWCNGDYNQLTKYCNNSSYGYNGFTDNLTVLQPMDDAVTANWGSGWRIPTIEQWEELIDNTTNTWTTNSHGDGYLFTASNGRSLFLPAAGERLCDEPDLAGYLGCYWSSSIAYGTPRLALGILFSSGSRGAGLASGGRCGGLSVRAVHEN